MGPRRSKIKKTSKSIMNSTKGESRYYTCAAVLGICIACFPLLVVASQQRESFVGASGPKVDLDGDLEAAESQNVAAPPQQPQQRAPVRTPVRAQVRQPVRVPAQAQTAPVAVPTNQVPVVAAPPPSPPSFAGAPPAGFSIPKTDLAGAPSYAPRYVVPPMDPWGERLPFDVQQFRRRAADDDGGPLPDDDDYKPSESKGKKHSPGVLKRFRNGIRNTGKAIVGAPSYILKRYRGTFKKYFGGGGGKKKKGGWKAWSPSEDKKDGWSGWEEVEPTGGYYEDASHYPSEKGGWKSKGSYKGYDSHERRYDRDSDRGGSSYRDYRDRDTNTNREYDTPPASSRPPTRARGERDRPRTPSYREETQYDEYDGRRTTAYYGPNSKKTYSKRPSSSSTYKYDDDY